VAETTAPPADLVPQGAPNGGAYGASSNLDQLTELVTQAAVLFYLAEEPQNPSVKTYWDALHYIATSLSVGYANIFPVTALGKAIGAVVQMVGPAMSSKALDRPFAPKAADGEALSLPAFDRELLSRLDAVLDELRALRGALPAAGPSELSGAAP
jgi:voltage-gated potassium channel